MEDTARYVINSVKLTSCPPVGDLEIRFSSSVTLISGSAGVGKSSLVAALACKKWPYGGAVEIDDRGDRHAFENLIPICIIDERNALETAPPSAHGHWVSLAEKHPEILEIAAHRLNQLMRTRLDHYNVPDFGDQTFRITVRRGQRPLVIPGEQLRTSSRITSSFFASSGERTIIHLAGVLAAREYLAIKCPLILDAPFDSLDENFLPEVVSFIAQLEDQVLVLSHPGHLEMWIERSSRDFEYVVMNRPETRE